MLRDGNRDNPSGGVAGDSEMPTPSISIVIPTLNERENLTRILASCDPPEDVEIIVVDGGSVDGTPEFAARSGVKLVISEPGRGKQMNVGAKMGKGEILLFLHGDTILPQGYHARVISLLETEGVVAGAFLLSIEGRPVSLRIIERVVNLRARILQMPFGDQALFMKKSVFEQVGGFREIPLMEDFDLVRALRKLGKIGMAEESVLTSGRRWERFGPWRTTLMNQIAIVAHLLGISPVSIAKFYHRKGRD
ncbi:MAG TPA: TIGR04283 family arsenosugar biosynthesis glycosyltransferase [Acidobacteriota bacterium]|nr:TIGR04283 family arsenosugar biosynthesis glycosyltransferase [Acidobacteriota bacterium]